MASALVRNAGKNSECSTSSDVKVTFTGAADGHVQLVDLVLAVEVLELPHPALAGGVNLERLVGRTLQIEEHARAPTRRSPSR